MSMHTLRPGSRMGTLVLALMTAMSSLASPAYAQAPKVSPEVSKHFALGNDYYQEGKYASALAEYDQAYELSTDEKGKRNWKILFNRGQCLVMLGREPEAIDSFQRYLEEGGDQVDASRRAQVEADIKRLRDRLGTIILEGTMPGGSEVTLDGRKMGKTPLPGAMIAASGFHDLVIRPPGNGQPYVASVKVIAGQQIAHRVVMTAAGPTPPTGPYVDTAPPPPPPPPVLPPRPPGGLTSPSIMATFMAQTSLPTRDYRSGSASALGGVEIGLAWRANGFWELGIFGAVNGGTYSIDDSARGTDFSLGKADVDPNASYAMGIVGGRVRMHLARAKRFDGWLGVDVGAWGERWKFTGNSSFTYSAASPAFSVGFGADIPLSPRWAVGFVARFLQASAASGTRTNCEKIRCDGAFLPGEGQSANAQSTSRGFVELGLRLVWIIPTGAPRAEPATPAPAPTTASRESLLRAVPIW